MPGLPLEHCDKAFHQLMKIEGFMDYLDLAGFNTGDIEDLLNQAKQVMRRFPDNASKTALLRIKVGAGKKIAHADDAVQRRAQLMTHIGDKLGFDSIGLLGIGNGFVQLSDQAGHENRDDYNQYQITKDNLLVHLPERYEVYNCDESQCGKESRKEEISLTIAKAIACNDP